MSAAFFDHMIFSTKGSIQPPDAKQKEKYVIYFKQGFTLMLATKIIRNLTIGTALLVSVSSVYAADGMSKEKKMAMQKVMQSDIALMKPDLQKQVKGLSKMTKMQLMKIVAGHSRRSKQLTLRQVMHEVLSDYQSIVSGLATDNTEQAADAARRLANHRLPIGGLIPYMAKEDVNDDKLSTLVVFNDLVEGNALRLAEAADKGDVSSAASYMGNIIQGCVACHATFRGQPGISNRLR
ncbi:MAG: hypothetical protein KAQ67_10400 [Gammaproteobacteria bacterium]|nr:hypothetical protein [Gammaproteobacteria bacterium]